MGRRDGLLVVLAVLGSWFNSMILKVPSHLDDSVILLLYLEIPLAHLKMFSMKLAVWKKTKSIWSRFQVFITITRTNISLSPRISCVGDILCDVSGLWNMPRKVYDENDSYREKAYSTDQILKNFTPVAYGPFLIYTLHFQPPIKVVSCTFCWHSLCLFPFSLLQVKFNMLHKHSY